MFFIADIGANATVANDAFGWVVSEIGIRPVFRQPLVVGATVLTRENVVFAVIAVAHLAQTDGAGHFL